jgi:hypothetical protein
MVAAVIAAHATLLSLLFVGSTARYTLASPHHLVVLVHGLHGSPSSLGNVEAALTREYQERGLLVHAAASNARFPLSIFSTADGVAAGGRRVAGEIADLLAAHPTIDSLSLVALSLGGAWPGCRKRLEFSPHSSKRGSAVGRLSVQGCMHGTPLGCWMLRFQQCSA